jgi:hypothetical protein
MLPQALHASAGLGAQPIFHGGFGEVASPVDQPSSEAARRRIQPLVEAISRSGPGRLAGVEPSMGVP